MRVAVLSNVNLDILLQYLPDDVEVFVPDGYGQWVQEAFQPSQALRDFDPEALVVLLHGDALVEEADTSEEASDQLSAALGHVERLTAQFATIPVLVSNLDLRPLRLVAGDAVRPEHSLMELWESGLAELRQAQPNAHLFDLRGFIESHGRANVYADKMWYLGSVPYSAKAMGQLADVVAAAVGRLRATRKKVLVVDLDNTLWGGVLGEDGADGITLSRSLQGAIYRDTQRRIKELGESGVLLAVVSKNDEGDVRKVLAEHPQMVLREDDFVAIVANWDDKPTNIASLAETLNLGLDSFVFLDDNPVEREAVALALPAVTVAEFPRDVSKLPALIGELAANQFFAARFTAEDLVKRQQYQQESLRRESVSAAGSLEDYLRSLEVTITISEVGEGQLDRVAQLTQKTNQFNLVTARFGREELVSYLGQPGHHVYVASVADRFGDSGLVLVLMVSQRDRLAGIDNLLMSCRVMGRHIEDAVLAEVERELGALGVTELHGRYLASERNQPVAELLDRLGFAVVADEPGERSYVRVVGDPAPDRRELHTVIRGER